MRFMAILAGVAVLAAPLLLGDDFYINVGSQVLIAAVLALSLNILVGYGGLTSLGHAAYLGASAYIVAWCTTQAGLGHLAAVGLALAGTTLMAAVFGMMALRATGIAFLMITLALGQTLWGVAYRWVTVTGGDNGLPGIHRPVPFGISLTAPENFYFFAIVVFLLAFGCIAVFVRSGLGVSLLGARDQPRRMRMLGHHVWLIQWIAFIMSGFWAAVAGILFVYYQQFISPHAMSLSASAEVLLMVIAGGAGTLLGPVVGALIVVIMKMVISAYVVRWVMLLGIIFILIVIFIPDGVVPGFDRLRRRLMPAGKEAA